jgi:mRNA deadenylase 3'-5' endonuclease subunit Ccr4
LQEVQADHYEAHMLPMMKDLGYDGLFKPKSRECTGLYGKVIVCLVCGCFVVCCGPYEICTSGGLNMLMRHDK